MRLLIVDDEYDIVELIAEECQTLGFQVDVAYHGDQARDLITKNPKYDLVLTDLNMPRMSGVELIQWLRSNSEKLCTIVVMTASIAAHPDLDLGMIDHLILKPFPMGDLVKVLKHYRHEKDLLQKQ